MNMHRPTRRAPRWLVLAAMLALLGVLPGFTAVAAPPAQGPDPTEPPGRPIVTLKSYYPDGTLTPGETFELHFRLANEGESKARNIMVSFSSSSFSPRSHGGVISAGTIAPAADTGYEMKLAINDDVLPGAIGSLEMFVSYEDPEGGSYDQSFTLTIPLQKVKVGTPRPTPTPTAIVRPQLLITSYETDFTPLQPGATFRLYLTVDNVGGARARAVSMILGGGTQATTSGTPEPGSTGGLSGASGDFANFAPVGSSNVQFLGDFDASGHATLIQRLVVNSSTKPGAYPLKISFVYRDESNVDYIDDQVITLLVYQSPVVEISFYRPPDPFSAGMSGMLPIQVVNLGRSSMVLGRIHVEADGGELANQESTVGLLDSGSYFTLDAMYTPDAPGAKDLRVIIDYLDDFNESKTIEQVLTIEVAEAPPMDETVMEGGPEGGGGGGEPAPEGFLQKLWRGVLGLLGLDSAVPGQGDGTPPTEPTGPYPSGGPKG